MALFITIDPVQIDSSITVQSINATKYKAYTDANGITRFLSKTFVDDLGRAVINQAKMTVGNYEIETHPGDWLHLWDKLTRPSDRSFVDTNPVPHGGVTSFNEVDFHNFDGNLNYGVATAANSTVDPTRYQLPLGGPIDGQASTTSLDAVSTGFRWAQAPQGPNNFNQFAYPNVNRGDTPMFIYVPLVYTCCSAPAQSLPMIALQYHDVKLSIKLNPIEQVSIFQSTGGSLRVKDAPQITATGAGINMSLVATYVFLDDAERRSVALSPHQFLMTEIQTQQFAVDPNATRSSYQLYFNHPVTELFVYFVKNAYRDSSSTAVVNHYWNWTFDGPQVEMSNYDATEAALGAPGFRQAFSRMNLALNQQKIYDDSRDAVWFTHFQPTKYHTRFIRGADRVAIIPFSLDCETWRPTGEVNFSRIDSVMLQLEYDVSAGQHLPPATAYVVARNTNIFKVVGGRSPAVASLVLMRVAAAISVRHLVTMSLTVRLLSCRDGRSVLFTLRSSLVLLDLAVRSCCTSSVPATNDVPSLQASVLPARASEPGKTVDHCKKHRSCNALCLWHHITHQQHVETSQEDDVRRPDLQADPEVHLWPCKTASQDASQ